MKTKRILIISIALVILTALAVPGIFRDTASVEAQTTQLPAVQRISFGMVGITSGQTLRLNVANTIQPNDVNLPPGPTRVTLNFRDGSGQLLNGRDGQPIHRTVMLQRGEATFLDLNFNELPPGPTRLQLRAVITIRRDDGNALPPDVCVPTVEIIDNASGRTQLVVPALPAVQRLGAPPDPD